MKTVGLDADEYLDFASQTFTSDKNSKGKTIAGSKKKKVFNYINSMNATYEEKIILAKLKYKNDDKYNYEIINYLNSDSSIDYDTMEDILKKLGFKVDASGNISWEKIIKNRYYNVSRERFYNFSLFLCTTEGRL